MPDESTAEPTDTNRDEVLRFRVTAKEKQDIERRSKAAGFKKTSDYLRTIGLAGEVKEVLPVELRKQLVGIGTNLNQIARRIQSSTLYATDEKTLHQLVATIRQYLV